jgi:hypothetical protein
MDSNDQPPYRELARGLCLVPLPAKGADPEGGVVATQYGMKAVAQGKGAANAIGGAFGLGDTSVEGRISTGLTVAGFIPGLGTAAAASSIGVDGYKTWKAVSQCP